jgi:hypothetical protein
MPPVRQSQRVRREVEPYQVAGPPQLTVRQQRRNRARYNERDGVPQFREQVEKKIRQDAKHDSISEAKAIKSKLGSTFRGLAKGKASKITAHRENIESYARAYRKYNLGDFDVQPHFDAFSLYKAPQ